MHEMIHALGFSSSLFEKLAYRIILFVVNCFICLKDLLINMAILTLQVKPLLDHMEIPAFLLAQKLVLYYVPMFLLLKCIYITDSGCCKIILFMSRH